MNQMGHHELALHIITDMYDDDIKIDEFSMTSFLSASAILGKVVTGKQLHCHSVKSGLDWWISVSNGLVDLYGKYGCICDAQRAFGENSSRYFFMERVGFWIGVKRSLREKYNIVPQLDHYVHLVDVLGQGGPLEEAMEVIQTMPFRADALIYKTLDITESLQST
ncbi:hypothetical protein REPUB_Repub08aG0130200 [Reevesia pubescens]